MTRQPARPRLRGLRSMVATGGALLIAVSIGACDGEDLPVDPPGGLPTPTPGAPSPEATDGPGLPPVATAVPRPDPVAGTLGETLTLSTTDLFGTETVTVDITVPEPIVVSEVETDAGTVITPDEDVFVGLELTIEGVEGEYRFNPRHFHLIPGGEVAGWETGAFDLESSAGTGWWTTGMFEPGLSPGSVTEGDRIRGYLVFDAPQELVDGAAVVIESFLLAGGPAAAYWPLD